MQKLIVLAPYNKTYKFQITQSLENVKCFFTDAFADS